MKDEFTIVVSHGTWNLVPRPSTSNLIGCKWVFRIKHHPDGIIDRFKACFVAKGFNQRPGVDYTETFSPVIKPTTIHLIFSLALSNNWALKQHNVNNVFLHGQLTKQVFMHQPAGFIDQSHPHQVCSL
jgi:histone deacetylase 1/2